MTVQGVELTAYVVAARDGASVDLFDAEGRTARIEGYPGEGMWQRVAAFGPHLRLVGEWGEVVR